MQTKELQNLPKKPGCYLFKNQTGEVTLCWESKKYI